MLRLIDGGRCWIKLTGPYRIIGTRLTCHTTMSMPPRTSSWQRHRNGWSGATDWPHAMKKKRMANDGEIAGCCWMRSARAWSMPKLRAPGMSWRDNPGASC